MTTTPTNEAGHGLPELPEWAKRDDLGGLVPSQIRSELRAYARAALALSRGVPADMVVMPREATPAMVDAWSVCNGGPTECYRAMVKAAPEHPGTVAHAPLYDSFDEWYGHYDGEGGPKNVEQLARDAWFGAQRQTAANPAPAAAGAQGEVADRCTDPENCRRCSLDTNTPHAGIPRHSDTPQPAAADGGVRERARELLAKAERGPQNDYGTVHRQIAHAAIAEALSSHRQAGDDLSEFRELAEEWSVRPGVTDAYKICADELMALVEKGAGNG